MAPVFEREVAGRDGSSWRVVMQTRPEPLAKRAFIRAYDAEQEVGHICFFLVQGGREVLVQVVDIRVDRAYRRRGLATLLWEQMEDYLTESYGPSLIDHGGLTPDGLRWYETFRAGHRESPHAYYPIRRIAPLEIEDGQPG